MGDAQARPQGAQQQAQTLALADLRTVKWVASQALVKEAYNVGKPRYLALKQAAIVGWVVVFYEMVLVWWWTFAHNLPWPAPVLAALSQLDAMAVRLLDFTQQRLEWWWDAWGVRLMWIRETFLARLDQYITIIDRYLLRVQDILAAILTLLITPLTIAFEYLNGTPKVVQKLGRADDDQRAEGQGRGAGAAHDDDDDDEEWGDDNLSDASTDSKLLLKNDPQGQSYNRLHTTIMAEGRLREAMYHRVKKELHLMRKNSIRFSYGIVTYARRMVPPRMYPYGESFLAYCQKWARELELWELTAPVQEVWSSDNHLVGKVLALARALCVAYLAFLLRLAKGKKSRRTRSMRSESFRRRTQNLSCSNSSLPLSPSALQQSSEPTPSHPVEVPAALQEAAQKEDEDSDDSLPENNVLISKENPTLRTDSDRTILPIDEEEESDGDSKGKKDPDHDISEDSIASLDEGGKDSGFSDKRSEDEEQGVLERPLKKAVTIVTESSPPPHKHKFKFNRGKKNLTPSY